MTLISIALLFFLVQDPIGNIPCFFSVLKDIDSKRRTRVIIRESLIALCILLLFMFTGKHIMSLLQISQSSLGIAGGIVLFLIAIKMIFSGSSEMFANSNDGEPLIVPLAVPFIAGPSSISTVILVMAKNPSGWKQCLVALVLSWIVASLVLLLSEKMINVLGNKFVIATERLMGMLLTVVAVEMFISSIKQSF